jgi:hypothetical protein
MKIKLNIDVAKEELKELQKFYSENCITYECRYPGNKITNKHNATINVADLKSIVAHLEETVKLYKQNSMTKLYLDTAIMVSRYKELLFLAERNGWAEICGLNFSATEFDRNAQLILEFLQIRQF